MRAYTVREIAKIVGGELIAGDGGIEITEFSTSSKEGGAATMFVPVIGERVDAHDFIGDAYAHGMRATFTCRRDVAGQAGQVADGGKTVGQVADGRETVGQVADGRETVGQVASEGKTVGQVAEEGETVGQEASGGETGGRVADEGETVGQVADGGKTVGQVADERQDNREDMAYVYIDLPGEKNPNVAALQRFGAYVRDTFSIPVVGITGSVGKTTTKEMVAAALETGLCTLKTAGNMNSQVGLPRMMCRLEKEHEIAVIEMGMSMPGEMARLVRVARPECAVMTNIGVSHIGQLGSKENIRREKLNIINGFPDGGVLFLNADDPMLRAVAKAWREACAKAVTGAEKKDGGSLLVQGVAMNAATAERLPHIRVVTYGTGEDCDYRAQDIRVVKEQTQFTLCRANLPQMGGATGHMGGHAGMDGAQDADGLTVHLAVTGQHNVLNALAALAVAQHYGIALEQAAAGLCSYRPIAMRGGKIRIGGMTLIDDTYNASPDSMQGGIDSLMAVKAARHIAVLADMLELGAISTECHEQVGHYAAGCGVDCIVAVGQEAESYVRAAKGADALHVHPVQGFHFADNAGALAFLKGFVQEGDAILFKGSRGMRLEELIAGLSGQGG